MAKGNGRSRDRGKKQEAPTAPPAAANPAGDFARAPAARAPAQPAPARSQPSIPPIVGIGASAGGLDAFRRLLASLPPDTGLAFVLIQHLDPNHESLLPEILGRAAKIPVRVAEDGVRLAADHVYVIPPNAAMIAVDGHLRVTQGPRAHGVHTVIDGFLESLADVRGGNAVAVILSGAGADGAHGVEAIKEVGGITIAQDPASAQFPSMPEQAIATGAIDFIFPPEQIAEQLAFIARHLHSSGDGAASGAAANPVVSDRILGMLRRRTGVDFRSYRRATIQRRILRRMLVHRVATEAEYAARLAAMPQELDALYEDLLIGVTRFFRDAETFAALQQAGFPEMLRDRAGDGPVRVWVAGCSGGEEAYSIAILLIEFLSAAGKDLGIQIFATDLSEAAIAKARTAVYPSSIEADVSPERLRRFFVRELAGGYRVSREVRELCVFATQNIVGDPPFSQLDLISCRNVLIYFEPALQRRALPIFHYALKPNGVLMLGAAESVGAESKLFAAFDKRHRLFKPVPQPRRPLDLATGARIYPVGTRAPARPLVDRLPADSLRHEADRAVLGRFGPPGVVVDSDGEITQFRGDTAAFLQHAPGAATLNVFKLVRGELSARLREGFDQAARSTAAVRTVDTLVQDGSDVRTVAIDALPVEVGPERERYYVVLFNATPPQSPAADPATAPATKRASKRRRAPVSAASDVSALQAELADTKRSLQDIIDRYAAANEELRAANEEIQSSNEELQSTNEELETTKEEVQSTNEELTTVNEEMRHRNSELAAISADLANVLSSTQIPVVIVDGELGVRRFTPVSDRVIRLIASDIGRPLGDVRLRVDAPDLEERVRSVIETLEIWQGDVLGDDGHWWALTIRPYLAIDRRVSGAVLVFNDIDVMKRSGQLSEETAETRRVLLVEAEAARAEATAANMTKLAFLANMSHDLRTPLNAITGYSDLMELGIHGPLSSEQMTDVARIKRSARHLLSLINDILNFAKVERGSVALEIGDVSLDGVTASIEELIFPQLRAKGLRFEQSCSGVVRADREKVEQILLNLVSNAMKFTTAGGISIRSTPSDDAIAIRVSDTGLGIPADQLGRIFEPFVQVNRSLTNMNHDGVGLGLAISRELARAMGGDITAESTPGLGSTFTLTLPRAGQRGATAESVAEQR